MPIPVRIAYMTLIVLAVVLGVGIGRQTHPYLGVLFTTGACLLWLRHAMREDPHRGAFLPTFLRTAVVFAPWCFGPDLGRAAGHEFAGTAIGTLTTVALGHAWLSYQWRRVAEVRKELQEHDLERWRASLQAKATRLPR